MKKCFTIALILISTLVNGQKHLYVLDHDDTFLSRDRLKTDSLHALMRPLHPAETKWLEQSPISKYDIRGNADVKVFPLIDWEGGLSAVNSNIEFNFVSLTGAGVYLKPGDKWNISANYLFGYHQPNEYLNVDSTHVLPGFGYANPQGANFTTHMPFGRVQYTPNTHFSFELGHDKNFIGHGHRSLMLSDNAAPNTYLKVDTKVWKVRYTNLYSWLYDMTESPGNVGQYQNKFTTTHVLDWRVTKRWSMGIFESIVWQAKDTLLNRGYDINYLNPIIFYRPVEYALGSADNALLGMSNMVRINDKQQFYSQIVIDEFLLDELRADVSHFFNKEDTTIQYGWWANKYGIQLGYKWDEIASTPLSLQAEMNVVRPFMYSHGSTLQNYGHANQSLAHPRGANFFELMTFVSYTFGKLSVHNQFVWSIYGTDANGISYGGDIYQSYRNRDGTYYHVIGQGKKNILLYNQLETRYLLDEQINLELRAGYRYRHNRNFEENRTDNFIFVGLRTNLFNRYTDF